MFTNNLLKKLSPVDTYVHLGRSHRSQHFFQRLCMILLLSLVGIGAAWAENLVCEDNWTIGKTMGHSLTNGQTMHITFHNVSNKVDNVKDGWHNWILAAGTAETGSETYDLMSLRADNYDNHAGGSSTVRDIKLNNGIINWETFVTDMKAGADVDIYVSNNGNNLYVKAVSTAATSGNVYTYTAQNSRSAGTVYISLMGQNCTLTDINFEAPVSAVTINVTQSNTTAKIKNCIDMDIASGSAVHKGEKITLEATANTDYTFRAWNGAPKGTSIVGKLADGDPVYKYRIDALNANATVIAKAEQAQSYQPTANNHYYNFAIVDGVQDYVVESKKATGDYDMLNFATISGGKTTLYNGNSSSEQQMVNSGAKAVNLNGSSASYMKVELLNTNAAGYRNVQVDDIFTFTGDGELRIGITDVYTEASITTSGKTYTVKEGDNIIGASTLYFFKNGKGQISTLNIVHPLPEHTITFNGNGNTGGSMDTQDVEEGIPTSIANNGFTRNAYVFKGWNTAADGTGTDYFPNADITLTEDVTLYAQWQRFSPMGGQETVLKVGSSINNYQLYYQSTKNLDISASDFTVTSNNIGVATVELGGWDNTNKRQTIKINGISKGSADVTVTFLGKAGTLYEQSDYVVTFTVNPADGPRTVSFDGNGGSTANVAPIKEETMGSGITLPKITPYAGYTFLGWSTNASATQPDANMFEGQPYTPNDDIMLYAVYSHGTPTVGSKNTSFWGAFSDFVKLDEGESYSATYSNEGGNETYHNWVLIATSNNTGHNGDGVQVGTGNERFALRADGYSWGDNNGSATMYRSNDGGATYTQLANIISGSPDADKTEFVEAMKNATSVDFSASRVGDYVYIYVTTTCNNGKRYVETYKSGVISADLPVYLSWTTDNSTITFSNQSWQSAYVVSGAADANGSVLVSSKEGVDVNNTAVPAGTQVTFKATPNSGYAFDQWSDGTTSATTVKTINATTNLVATFRVETYNYTVRAVDGSGNVLNANVASGTYNYGDPAVKVAYPQHILKGTSLYEIANNGSGDYFRKDITPDRQNYVYDLVYNKGKVDNVVFYTEAEDITGFTPANYANRASNGKVGYNATAQATSCTLSAGLYQIFIRGVNGNAATRAVAFTDGTNNLATLGIPNGTDQKSHSPIFEITGEKTLYVSSEGSTSSGLDWFYVKKYDDVLLVTENGQRYTLSKDNATNDAFFSSSTGTSNWAQKTVNGQKEYLLDMKSNRTETIKVTGAISYEIIVMNSGDNNVDLTVNGVNKNIPLKSTSSTGLITVDNPGDVTTITLTNTSSNTIYPYQIIFYTESPKATLNTDEVTAKVGMDMTFDLSTASGGTIKMNPSVVSNEFASSISFDGSQLSVTGSKEGSFDLTFDIGEGGGYAATAGYKLKVNVEKQLLTLKFTPEYYKYNSTTNITEGNLKPTLSATIEKEDGTQVEFNIATVTVTYNTDDESIATVATDGQITLTHGGQGSADITASVPVDNVIYKSNVATYPVTIEQGMSLSLVENNTPSVGDVLTLKDEDGTTPLVYATFGGWKWGSNGDKNDHSYVINGSIKTDSWAKTGQYTGTQGAKPYYVDGYSWQSGGQNDACDEYKGASDSEIFGKTRYGWFRPTNDPHISPFSLPVRGTYMTFEPQQNGMLTVYILQNGAFNSTTAADGSSKVIPGEFQPHSFHVVDQNGTPVPSYTDFKFIVKEPVTQKTTKDEAIVCSYDATKQSADFDNGQVPAGVTYDEKDVATWPMFYQNFTKDERIAIKKEWTGGKNGAQGVVKLHDGSFLITQKAYVKYTFYVAASRTYYLFSNFSKMGFAAMNFVKDASQPDESDILALNENTTFPTLRDASYNVSDKLSIPQYGKITVDRTDLNAGIWSTICLPFDMTEREVEENFGKGTELLLFDGTQENEHNHTLHFVYHEIQSILAGYPYMIKPAQTVSQIVVKNKMIQPKNSGDALHQSFEYDKPKDLVTFSSSRYWTHTPYIPEDSEDWNYTMVGTYGGSTTVSKGSLYVSKTDGTLKRLTAESSNLKGYRAYLNSNKLEENYSKSITVFMSGHDFDNDDETTSIREVFDDEGESSNVQIVPVKGIYTISGQKMNKDIRNLPKGIYIINGKKMYVK